MRGRINWEKESEVLVQLSRYFDEASKDRNIPKLKCRVETLRFHHEDVLKSLGYNNKRR